MAFHRGYQPVLAKHTKNFNLTHALEIGVSDMQCNFDGMVQQIDRWRDSRLTDVSARMIVYEAFIEAETDFPRHLARPIYDLYFNPQHEEFGPGRCGASPTPSRARSNSSTPFRSFARPPSWDRSWKRGSCKFPQLA
jgi:hypothetical protein